MSVGSKRGRDCASRGVNSGVRRGRMVGRSKVWRLASFVDGGRSEVGCSLCPVRIKYVGNTTNIARHLELRHPVEFAALDPSTPGGGRGGSRHHHRQHQQSREEAAICRILAQHQEELQKQTGGGGAEAQQQEQEPTVIVPEVTPCLMPAPKWSWHTPVQGEYCYSYEPSGQCCTPAPRVL